MNNITLDTEKRYEVKPLGGVGHTYSVNRKTYFTYIITCCLILLLMLAIGIVDYNGRHSNSDWPLSDGNFYLIMLAILILGYKVIFYILSKGEIICNKDKTATSR